jgi:plastocyanin
MKPHTPAPPTVASGHPPPLTPGAAFTEAFPNLGEFAYHCEFHPFMTGRIIVE